MLFLIILILTLISGCFLPWWVAAIVSFLAAAYFGKSSAHAFWSGFGGLFFAWVVLALVKSIPNENILATRVAHLFHLPNWGLLLLVTAIIGGLAGGLAALSGLLVKNVFQKK